jgi:hypothetical protein
MNISLGSGHKIMFLKIEIPIETVENMYFLQNLSYSQIADVFGCSAQTICNRMKEYNMIPRTVSESLKGRDIHWKTKIAKANTGKKRPGIGGRVKGFVGWNKGLRKATHPDKIKYGCSKEEHWSWKGGISAENCLIRQSSEYKVWRDTVFKRDNYSCTRCMRHNGSLEAHHIKAFSDYEQLRFDPTNGITLCSDCHKETHHE